MQESEPVAPQAPISHVVEANVVVDKIKPAVELL
jgi:hypothetical protein